MKTYLQILAFVVGVLLMAPDKTFGAVSDNCVGAADCQADIEDCDTVAGKCVCAADHINIVNYPTFTGGSCGPDFCDVTCPAGDCSNETGYYCNTGTCACDDVSEVSTVVDVVKGGCIRIDCDVDETACNGITNAYCSPFTDTCECDFIHSMSQTTGHCEDIACTGVGDECGTAESAECRDNICACMLGHHNDGDICDENDVFDLCSTTEDCSTISGGYCILGVCMCGSLYRHNCAGSCMEIDCMAGDDMTLCTGIRGATCSPTTSKCVCMEGYILNEMYGYCEDIAMEGDAVDNFASVALVIASILTVLYLANS